MVTGLLYLVYHLVGPPLNVNDLISRSSEQLPAVIVQPAGIVYCRMRYCDFKFPLPEQACLVQTNLAGGGFDTIDGAIYVVGTNGAPVNMRAYAEFLRKNHWAVTVESGLGCGCCTNSPDVPFSGADGLVRYPQFDEFQALSTRQPGGLILVGTESGATRIRFSYFGDD